MLYVKLGILALGAIITLVAGGNVARQWNADQQAVTIDLAELERGASPPSRYVRIVDYVPRHDMFFVQVFSSPNGIENYEYFYPIVSHANPGAAGEEVPLTHFAVVVRPNYVKRQTNGAPVFPTGPLEGALAIGIDALEGKEQAFVAQEFPEVDAAKVHVLVPGQKPWISVGSWIWLIFGAVVLLVGAGSLLVRSE